MEQTDYTRIAGIVFVISMTISLGEMLWITAIRKLESFRHAYAQPLKNAVFVSTFTFVVPILGTAGFALLGAHWAPLPLGEAWYVWPLGLLIFEFWYWLMHWLGHKVRLIWCIHSAHHAPDTLTSLIGLGRNILELPYFAFFLGFMTAFSGVPVEVILVISLIDGFWGKFLHISPTLVPGRYGPLEYFMQTPAYHRCHHAKNLIYMDTNYTSITLFWDWLFGTLQPLKDSEPVQYGITRKVNDESWFDVQLGEFRALWTDMRHAPGLANKLLYLLMPPGWSHCGDHKTVTALRLNAQLESSHGN